jgi:HD-like signal output (HDOD) protein
LKFENDKKKRIEKDTFFIFIIILEVDMNSANDIEWQVKGVLPNTTIPELPEISTEIRYAISTNTFQTKQWIAKIESNEELALSLASIFQKDYYTGQTPIKSINQSVQRLGPEGFWCVVLEHSLNQTFYNNSSFPEWRPALRYLQKYNLFFAHLCRIIARNTSVHSHEAFQAGLLQNIGRVIALRAQDYKRKYNELQGIWDAISLVHPLIGTYAIRIWGLDKNIQRAILNQGQVYFNNKPHTLSAILVLTQNLLSQMGKECSGPANWLDKASIPSSKSTLHKDIPMVPSASMEEALTILDLEKKDLQKIGAEFVKTLKRLRLM